MIVFSIQDFFECQEEILNSATIVHCRYLVLGFIQFLKSTSWVVCIGEPCIVVKRATLKTAVF